MSKLTNSLRRILGFSVVVLTASTSIVKAQDMPTSGLLYHTTEDHSLSYTCSPTGDNTIECEFVQVMVRKKAKEEDLNKRIEDAKASYPKEIEELTTEEKCNGVKAWMLVAKGSITPEDAIKSESGQHLGDAKKFLESFQKMSVSEKEDVTEFFGQLDELCSTHSEESYLNIFRALHERDMQTCLISSNPYKQSFNWIQDSASGRGAWVADNKPVGPCGIVQLSRFEPAPDEFKGNSKSILFWNYIAQKAITNSKGMLLPNFACSSLDQREYTYEWKQNRPYKLNCKYIEFSAY